MVYVCAVDKKMYYYRSNMYLNTARTLDTANNMFPVPGEWGCISGHLKTNDI